MRYTFNSLFAPHIIGLIEQKYADGFSYVSGEKLLKRFDTFCEKNYPEANTITYNLVSEWSVIRPTEGRAFRDNRMNALRQLSLYMLSLGLDAHVPRNYSKNVIPCRNMKKLTRFKILS